MNLSFAKWCGVDYFDFYLMHAQGAVNYGHFRECSAYETGLEFKAEGKAYLEEYGIPCTCETITDRIINRSGTDVCPMKKTVAGISDCDEAYEALKAKLEQLRS